MNVVSIMAHQDDEMRCLGSMLKCQARGDKLFFVTLADGSKGMMHKPDLTRAEAAAIRHAEMQSLVEAVGGEFINLREQDEFLYDTPEVRMKLIEAIRATRAEVIFTHYSEDYNLDHVTVNRLMLHCTMQSTLTVLPTGSPPLKESPAVFMGEPFGAFVFPATHYVDISDFEERKVKLLLMHKSQEEASLSANGRGLSEMYARFAAHRGAMVGCRFAEAFIPMQGRIKAQQVLP